MRSRFDGGREGHGPRRWSVTITLAVIVLAGLGVGFVRAAGESEPVLEFTDVEKQTREFIEYNKTIVLTTEQEAIKYQALEAIPAPCCADRSAYTCCCSCNMAQSWWGLSKHLIANKGHDAEAVREAVEGWIEFINPDGFTGESCYTGGCGRPFHRNGCGGMDANQVVF